jgi:hypothetical protein
MNEQRCTATTKLGKRCGGRPIREGYCYVHHPHYAERNRAGRLKGARSTRADRAMKALPSDARGLAELLLGAIQATADGQLNPQVLSAIASGSRAYAEIARASLLEEKFVEVEALLREGKEKSVA